MSLEKELKTKPLNELAKLKAEIIAKCKTRKYTKGDFNIEIIEDIKPIKIEGIHGIELFAKAWKKGKKCGFGKDGTTEIERFRIYNPPILVPDENGDIIREYTEKDILTGENLIKQRKFRENPEKALQEELVHIISLIEKNGENIVDGKIGNTTSTFYSVAGANSPVDGFASRTSQATYPLARDTADGLYGITSDTVNYVAAEVGGGNYSVYRLFNCFNTATLGTDTITSAIVSLYFAAGVGSQGIGLTQGSLASTANITTGDFDACTINNPDEGATRSSFPSAGYNNWTLNATGRSWIEKSGVTDFCFRDVKDIDDETPPASPRQYKGFYSADYTGSTTDPKLVVVHSASVAGKSFAQII